MQKHHGAAASPSATTVLGNDAQAPGLARLALEEFAALPVGRMNDARIVVTELVTNSVLHASGDSIELELRFMPDHLVIEVTDGGGRGRPSLVTGGGEAAQPHGWGLRLVESLTEAWGVRDVPGRRTVWCALRIADGDAPPHDGEFAAP